jgi:AcrR family transcriptional regulator
MPEKTNASTNSRADLTKKAILRAAIREFSEHGLAGARTDTIAESAKVNKALLYYYFQSKKGLYAAAIEEVSSVIAERAFAALDPERSAGDRILRTALIHFDRIFTQRDFQSLMQQEMVRVRRGESEGMPFLVRNVLKPLLEKLQQADGLASGGLLRARRECPLFPKRADDAPGPRLRSDDSGCDRSPAKDRGTVPRQHPVRRPCSWRPAR